jgi:8-hydroxy-5-deazaflavin:NADPH oxidoreductase
MNIAVLGTGTVGRLLSGRLAGLGHTVTIGTRDVGATLARTGEGAFSSWHAEHPQVAVAAFADLGAGAEVLVNATSGAGSVSALQAVGAANLAGKVLLDLSNPLDFSAGFPPTLSVVNTDSAAERLQREFPQLRVVKSLNTMSASIMIDPGALAGGDHTVFVSGDDPAAKETVSGLLREFGWTDILDLGELSSARGAEMVLPLWLRLMQSLGATEFNFKIVR